MRRLHLLLRRTGTALLVAVLLTGCQRPESPAAQRIDEAWVQRTRAAGPLATRASTSGDASPTALIDQPAAKGGTAIAYVDGRPIDRQTLVNLLIAGHGVGIFEQLVVLERARRAAEKLGIKVTEANVVAEHERSLRSLLSPIEAANESGKRPPSFDHAEAEHLLDEILSKRNVSRAEYRAVTTRNAYLRAIVENTMTFTDEQLEAELQREYGERVRVRHIQLSSLLDAEHIAANLTSGADFAEQARKYSANLRTAPAGGLLPDFTRDEPTIPEPMRKVAFQLEEGELSDPVRVDDWYHLVKLVKRIPAEHPEMEVVRPVLEEHLRERLATPAMQTLYRSLFEQADIRIEDPILREEFERKHPGRLED